jgi:hypothetical protein
MHQYYHELVEMMGDARGLVIVPYVAPAVALEKGKYSKAAM